MPKSTVCTASKTIKLGDHAEVLVGCGLLASHAGVGTFHLAQDTKDDGTVITVRWPS